MGAHYSRGHTLRMLLTRVCRLFLGIVLGLAAVTAVDLYVIRLSAKDNARDKTHVEGGNMQQPALANNPSSITLQKGPVGTADTPGLSPHSESITVAASKTANNTVLAHLIPHNLLFTYAHNVLESKAPSHFFDNVQHTIAEYRRAWGQPEAPVHFLDDDDCRTLLNRVEPALVQYFDAEKQGKFKADICRVAALYESGGYYFDVDIQVVKPFHPADGVSFTTVVGHSFDRAVPIGKWVFFQAFLASAPRHPILREALRIMLLHYEGSHAVRGADMGPSTLQDAYHAVPKAHRGDGLLLQEVILEAGMYPDLPRLQGTGLCNLVVHDQLQSAVYFFSRIVGTPMCGTPEKVGIRVD
mmetsp:Transcript_19914/g.32306  ORF Transcript_19914/g.32306 Transcript_19914/m.32306 type:complete len:356 (-) Transcript_19914:326-1393(-)